MTGTTVKTSRVVLVEPIEKARGEAINAQLERHQFETARDWAQGETVRFLREWFDRFNVEFFFPQVLPAPALSLAWTRRSRLGHYVPGRNGFGLCHEINLNAAYLDELTNLEKLEVLAHEMIHEWQQIYGRPSKTGWYHNRQFCRKAEKIGLLTQAPRGCTIGVQDPFLAVCRAHGVNDPVPKFVAAEGHQPRSKGCSTLKKWVCGCVPPVNAWIGVQEFDATCNHCTSTFRRA